MQPEYSPLEKLMIWAALVLVSWILVFLIGETVIAWVKAVFYG